MTGRTKRDALKRVLAQAHHHCDLALEDLLYLKEQFNPSHPELADGLQMGMELIRHSQEIIETFALVAWNMQKDVFDAYRE